MTEPTVSPQPQIKETTPTPPEFSEPPETNDYTTMMFNDITTDPDADEITTQQDNSGPITDESPISDDLPTTEREPMTEILTDIPETGPNNGDTEPVEPIKEVTEDDQGDIMIVIGNATPAVPDYDGDDAPTDESINYGGINDKVDMPK